MQSSDFARRKRTRTTCARKPIVDITKNEYRKKLEKVKKKKTPSQTNRKRETTQQIHQDYNDRIDGIPTHHAKISIKLDYYRITLTKRYIDTRHGGE